MLKAAQNQTKRAVAHLVRGCAVYEVDYLLHIARNRVHPVDRRGVHIRANPTLIDDILILVHNHRVRVLIGLNE